MAPTTTSVTSKFGHDDFVFTLSDREDGMEAESDTEPAPAPKANIGKKRKRSENVESDAGRLEGGSSKKQKADSKAKLTAGKKNKRKTKVVEEGAESEQDDDDDVDVEHVTGELDDAINPDFEFDAGDGGFAGQVIEDFDGWGEDTGKTLKLENKGAKTGNKKGVNIDEIIARRLEMKKNKPKSEEQKMSAALIKNGHVEDAAIPRALESEKAFEVGGYEDEDEERDEDEADGMLNFEDDELLATDGFGAGAESEDEAGDSDEDQDQDQVQVQDLDREDARMKEVDSDDEADSVASPTAHPDDLAPSEGDDSASNASLDDDPAEAAKRLAFFAPPPDSIPSGPQQQKQSLLSTTTTSSSFQSFSLSRPLLRGIAALNFTKPTPIQSRTIPIALLGKDVVGSAQTGSGKTAAFLLPILERLLYRPRKVPTTRVAILMPTRELAVQCFNVATQLAQFTDITFAQLVGGFSLREQEAVLKKRPDVVICTPGRFIDHTRNSPSFSVETLEILVLDEADRMLEDGFADELDEILKAIPRGRQTMLFSATMTESVDKLVRVGMDRPVRVSVDKKKETVGGLVQEFVRLRAGREDKRLANLLVLCTTVYTERVIIFFRQKKEAHRVRTIFGLCGVGAGELHGGMTQEQRIASVSSFRSGQTTHLLATDLASRGLDIKNVATVINYEAPQSYEIYLHRVGRTARAGKSGRACTIAAEPDRKVVKAAVKSGRAQGAKIVSRVLPADSVDNMHAKLAAMYEEVDEILAEEKEERQMAAAETHLTKGENLIKHADEIQARPKRTWFESEKDKRTAKKAGRAELNGPSEGKAPKGEKKKKLSGKDKKRLDDRRERIEGKVWKKGKGSEAAVSAAAAAAKSGKGKAKGKGRDKRDGVGAGRGGDHANKGKSQSRGSGGGGGAGKGRKGKR